MNEILSKAGSKPSNMILQTFELLSLMVCANSPNIVNSNVTSSFVTSVLVSPIERLHLFEQIMNLFKHCYDFWPGKPSNIDFKHETSRYLKNVWRFAPSLRLEKMKKTRFSGTTIGCSGNFYKILGIAVNYVLCEKKQEIYRKSPISSIFPAFSARKKFSKLDSARFSAFLIRILAQKIRKKQIMKSWENAKKKGFPAYFRHFQL